MARLSETCIKEIASYFSKYDFDSRNLQFFIADDITPDTMMNAPPFLLQEAIKRTLDNTIKIYSDEPQAPGRTRPVGEDRLPGAFRISVARVGNNFFSIDMVPAHRPDRSDARTIIRIPAAA